MAAFGDAALHAGNQSLGVIKRNNIQRDHVVLRHGLLNQCQLGLVGKNRFTDKRLFAA